LDRSSDTAKLYAKLLNEEQGSLLKDKSLQKEQNTVMTITANEKAIRFPVGSDTLQKDNFVVLNKISDLLAAYPDYNIEVGGHTDNVGDPQLNKTLSVRRAKVVYDYLVSEKGLPVDRVSYVGYGQEKPLSDNNTPEGRDKNRRVEIILIK
jgi:outer membrane protein OmpA-like peptidoglycan-associated protein